MQTNSQQANTMPNIPEIIGVLRAAYTCVFSLEMMVFSQYKGQHKANERKQLASYLTGKPVNNVNIVELADLIRNHFDQLRLF